MERPQPYFRKLAAFGDCNTLGANGLRGKSYPERVGTMLGAEVCNLGHSMATTREGLRLLRDRLGDADCVFIHFGLADSFKTFKYAPYILYYPDSFLRGKCRSLVKKYKKICRRSGMNTLFGEVNSVPLEEYERNLRSMIRLAEPRPVFLLEIIPSLVAGRNEEIRRYNAVLDKLSGEFDRCCRIELFAVFEQRKDEYYQDETHCNSRAYDYIARLIKERIDKLHL